MDPNPDVVVAPTTPGARWMRQIRRLRWLFWFIAAINVGMGIATIAYTDASTMTKGALVIYMAVSALMLGAYPSLVTTAYEMGVDAGKDSVVVNALGVRARA